MTEDCQDYLNSYGMLIDGKSNRPKDCIDISQITSRIFLGSYDSGGKMYDGLRLFGITHILTVGHNMPPAFEGKFKYHVMVMEDHHKVDISKYFPESFEFIKQALDENETNKVLIHCYAGVSRSASVTIAWLIHTNLMSYPEACEYVRKARHWIDPNRGFRSRLRELAEKMGEHSESDSKKYESAGKILKKMHEKKTITPAHRDTVLSIFENVFGELHPHTLDAQMEIQSFVSANTV